VTDTAVQDPPRSDAPGRDQVAEIADRFVALMRTFGKARARMLAAAEYDVEWSAHVLLKALSTEGSMRASALADCVHSDPSTVSRQVAALVKDGLLERRADPVDGRASLLVLTPKAAAVLAEQNEVRLDFFARVLRTWSPEDVDQFAALLGRFTADYADANTDYLTERIAGATAGTAAASRAVAAPAEGSNS
jgi:DNA-binding MarR family transcriptional regulator